MTEREDKNQVRELIEGRVVPRDLGECGQRNRLTNMAANGSPGGRAVLQ